MITPLEPLREFPVPPPGVALSLADDPVEIDGLRVQVHRTVALFPIELAPPVKRPREREASDA